MSIAITFRSSRLALKAEAKSRKQAKHTQTRGARESEREKVFQDEDGSPLSEAASSDGCEEKALPRRKRDGWGEEKAHAPTTKIDLSSREQSDEQ